MIVGERVRRSGRFEAVCRTNHTAASQSGRRLRVESRYGDTADTFILARAASAGEGAAVLTAD